MVQRRRHPEARAAGARHRQQRVDRRTRPPRSYLGYLSLGERAARPAHLDLRAGRHRARGGGAGRCSRRPPTPRRRTRSNLSQPSDALTARAAAAGAFDSLFLGLGVVALIVGAVGVANIMIISVLERRSEIGLRRALGATQGSDPHASSSASRSCSPSIGGVVGVLAGGAATAVYASSKGWDVVIPVEAWSGGIALGRPDRRGRRPAAGRPSVRGCRLPSALRTA